PGNSHQRQPRRPPLARPPQTSLLQSSSAPPNFRPVDEKVSTRQYASVDRLGKRSEATGCLSANEGRSHPLYRPGNLSTGAIPGSFAVTRTKWSGAEASGRFAETAELRLRFSLKVPPKRW